MKNYCNEYAKNLADNGFRLLALGEGTKIPIARKWPQAARSSWIDEQPDRRNWGVACGDTEREDRARLVVIDVDTKEGKTGNQELEALIKKYGAPPPTYRVRSWSGGLHLYFLTTIATNSFRKTMSTPDFPNSSIDIQGPGKQVVAPGSYYRGTRKGEDGTDVTEEGEYIEDRDSPLFREIEEIAFIDEWFGEVDARKLLLQTDPEGQWRTPYEKPERIKEGENSHNAVMSLAGMLNARYGLREDALMDTLLQVLTEMKSNGTYEGALDREWLQDFVDYISRNFSLSHKDDLYVAEWVVLYTRTGAELKYVVGKGFYAWDGVIWRHAKEDNMVFEGMSSLARSLDVMLARHDWEFDTAEKRKDLERRYDLSDQGAEDEKGKLPNVKLWEAVRKKLSNTHSRRSVLSAIKENAQSLGIAADADEFNSNRDIVVCGNGTLEFDRKGGFTFRENRKEDLMTKRLNIEFSPDASCPTFKRIMEMNIAKELPGVSAAYSLGKENSVTDTETLDWLQLWLGYCTTGRIDEHKIVMLHGHGRNGKSLLIETLADLLGIDDYYTQVDPWILDAKNQKNGDPVKLKLQGARLAVIHEAPAYQLDESELKALTSGDPITARGLYEKYVVTFQPTHKLMYVSNNRPKIKTAGASIWDKLVLVPFRRYINDRETDSRLNEKLKQEQPGIFNWLVEGACKWYELQASGRTLASVLSPVLRAEIDQYKEDEVPLKSFRDQVLVPETGARIKGTDLYSKYLEWEVSRQTPSNRCLGQKSFYTTLGELGIPVGSYANCKHVFDYRLKSEEALREVIQEDIASF